MSSEPTSARGSASNPAPSGPAAGASPAGAASATIRYVDRADMVETFADSVTGLIFDGQTLRIEADNDKRAAYSNCVADLQAARQGSGYEAAGQAAAPKG
jgi:hypothetical protein